MTYTDIYRYENYLENLMMAKVAHSAGVPVNDLNLTLFSYSDGYGSNGTGNFNSILSASFEIVEFYESAECHESELAYWLNEANRESEEDHEYLGVFVILDETLVNAKIGVYGTNDRTDSSATIYQFELGVIIVYDENYGEPSWTEILQNLYSNRDKVLNQQKKEANVLEMAT